MSHMAAGGGSCLQMFGGVAQLIHTLGRADGKRSRHLAEPVPLLLEIARGLCNNSFLEPRMALATFR